MREHFQQRNESSPKTFFRKVLTKGKTYSYKGRSERSENVRDSTMNRLNAVMGTRAQQHENVCLRSRLNNLGSLWRETRGMELPRKVSAYGIFLH